MSETITVIEKKALSTVTKAQNLVIKNNEQYVDATDFLKAIKALEKEVEDTFNPIIEKAHQAHKEALGQKEKYFKPLVNAERLIKGKIADYDTEQERIRAEAEAKLRREAEAEEARLRKIKEEQERVWREKEEAARKETERLAKAGKEEEAAKARAEADRAARMAEERRLQAEEVQVVAPTLAPTVEKVAGISFKENWTAEVVDVALLPKGFMIPDMPKLNQYARTMKSAARIAGVKFLCEKVVSSTAR